MVSFSYNSAFLDYKNFICTSYSRKSMGYNNSCFIFKTKSRPIFAKNFVVFKNKNIDKNLIFGAIYLKAKGTIHLIFIQLVG